MIPSGVRVWLAVGRTDMRKGMNGLALQVQQVLGRDPHAGDLYVFRGCSSATRERAAADGARHPKSRVHLRIGLPMKFGSSMSIAIRGRSA